MDAVKRTSYPSSPTTHKHIRHRLCFAEMASHASNINVEAEPALPTTFYRKLPLRQVLVTLANAASEFKSPPEHPPRIHNLERVCASGHPSLRQRERAYFTGAPQMGVMDATRVKTITLEEARASPGLLTNADCPD